MENESLESLMGWLSFACWLLVYSPQMYENYKNKSGEGVSIYFILIWMIGDLSNLLGSYIQRLLPTMIALAVYYTFCDFFLFSQIAYYKRKNQKGINDSKVLRLGEERGGGGSVIFESCNDDENDNLDEENTVVGSSSSENLLRDRPLTDSSNSLNRGDRGVVVVEEEGEEEEEENQSLLPRSSSGSEIERSDKGLNRTEKVLESLKSSDLSSYILTYSLILIIGLLSWKIAQGDSKKNEDDGDGHDNKGERPVEAWNTTAQILGWISATAYLGSRLPQIIKNRQTKCRGLSLLFFLVGITGNITYFSSILVSRRDIVHIWINLSWLVGSGGCVFLDFIVLYQFWIYRKDRLQF